MSVNLGSAHGSIEIDASGVERGVNQATSSLSGLTSAVSGIGGAMATVGAAAATGVVALAGLGVAAANAAGTIESSVANIKGIKPEIDTDLLFNQLNEMSTQVPQSAQELGDSLYNIFSSIDVTQEQAVQLLSDFSKGATAAMTDADTFGTAILGVMNAYGSSVGDASHISDVFFNTVNRGVISSEELANGLGTITPAAKAAGVSIEEMGALVVGVTKEGGNASENLTNLQNVLNKITTKPAQDGFAKLGIAVTDSAGNFRSTIDVFGDLKTALSGMTEAERINALQTIFPDIQARAGAQTIMNQIDAVNAALIENQTTTGSTAKAYANMAGTFKTQSAILKNTAVATLASLGKEILPLATQAVVGMSAALKTATPYLTDFAKTIGQTVANAMPQIIAAFKQITPLIASFVAGLGKLDLSGVHSAFNQIATAAQALVAAMKPALASFAEVFTPERIAIIKAFAATLAGIAVDRLTTGMNILRVVLPPVVTALGTLVGYAIDAVGALENTGHAADAVKVALGALTAILALNAFSDFVRGVQAASSELANFWNTITRGPKLVVTTIRTAYETAGKVADVAGGVIERVVKVGFAGAEDAALWAQLYAEQASQTITRTIKTIFEKPPDSQLPDIPVKVIPKFDTSSLGTLNIPDIKVNVQPQVPETSVGTVGTDIGIKLAGGIASGIGGAIAGALVAALAAAGLGTAIGGAIAAAAPFILAAAGIAAIAAAAFFIGQLVVGFVQAQGGIGPALAQVFLVAIPTALGMLAGVLANLGLQLIVLILQGLTQGIPALVGFLQANFQTIITTIALVLAPLPTLVFAALSAVLPIVLAFGQQMLTAITTAFGQVATAIGTALSTIGTVLSTLFSTIVSTVTGAIGEVIGVFVSMGSQILDAVQNAFAPIADIISAIISGDWGAAVDAGIQLIVNLFVVLPGQLIAIISGGFSAIVSIITSALSTIVSAIGTAWTGITTAIGTALSTIQAAISTAWSTITTAFTTALSTITNAVTTGFNSVMTTITSILTSIGSAITTALSNFVSGFTSTFNSDLPAQVKSGMAALLSGVTSGLASVMTEISALPGKITGALSGMASGMRTLGEQALQGLADGITAAGSRAIQAAKDIAGQVLGAVGGILGIHSPSRVLRQYGQWTIQGLEIGMHDRTPQAVSQAIATAEEVTGAMQATLNDTAPIVDIDTKRFDAPTFKPPGFTTLPDKAVTPLADGITAATEAIGRLNDAVLNVGKTLLDLARSVLAVLPLGPGGATVTIHHAYDPIRFEFMTPNGAWVVSSLAIDGKSRGELADMIAGVIAGAAPAA